MDCKRSEENVSVWRTKLVPRSRSHLLNQNAKARSLGAYMRLVQEQFVQRGGTKIKLTFFKMLRFFAERPDPQSHVLYIDR